MQKSTDNTESTKGAKSRDVVLATYRDVMKSLGPGKKAPVVAKTKKMSAAMLALRMKRKYAALDADSNKWLVDNAPPNSTIWVDTTNGRWRLTNTILSAKRSVSWTNVGNRMAAGVALRQLYEWAATASSTVVDPVIEACLRDLGV